MKLLFLLGSTLLLFGSCGEDYGKGRRPTVNPAIPGQLVTAEIGVPTYLHRDRGQAVLSSEDAIAYLLDPGSQRDELRSIPLLEKDDEGSSLNARTLGEAKGRPGVPCGLQSGLSLKGRLADCAEKNLEKASWEAVRFGVSGEADWKLLARNNFGLEIWMDQRTKMLWADASSGANWCEAAGNTQEACAALLPNFESRVCQGIAGIGDISWRLPTRNDFLQADLDGIRFVLPLNIENGFWTATLDSASVLRDKAWVYESEQGTLSSAAIKSLRPVRCIGALRI